jgi:hypothetical protein
MRNIPDAWSGNTLSFTKIIGYIRGLLGDDHVPSKKDQATQEMERSSQFQFSVGFITGMHGVLHDQGKFRTFSFMKRTESHRRNVSDSYHDSVGKCLIMEMCSKSETIQLFPRTTCTTTVTSGKYGKIPCSSVFSEDKNRP